MKRLVLLMVALPLTSAAAPALIPVTGYLTGADGTPTVAPVPIAFELFEAQTGGDALWTETQTVTPDSGAFTAYLGAVTDLDLGMFADRDNVWLAVAVDGDPPMERVRLGTVPWAAYAQDCGSVPEHTHEDGGGPAGDHSHDADDLSGVALTGQSCPGGEVMTGIALTGGLECGLGQTYSGLDFALSGKQCEDGQVMVGVSFTGTPVCSAVDAAGGVNYDGTDFALSGKVCPPGQVMTGIDGAGFPVCSALPGGGGGGGDIEGSGTTGRLPKFTGSKKLGNSILTESSNRIGINDTSPSRTLDVKGDLQVTGDFYWGGKKFTSSSCVVMGGTSCSSACGSHGMTCSKAFRIDGESTSTSCSQSGFKFCCCRN